MDKVGWRLTMIDKRLLVVLADAVQHAPEKGLNASAIVYTTFYALDSHRTHIWMCQRVVMKVEAIAYANTDFRVGWSRGSDVFT
jgi:hypothetical protein